MSRAMKAIQWIGPQRVIRRVGLVSFGHKLEIPGRISLADAESFCRQGLAEPWTGNGNKRPATGKKE